jgi:hypothetical protein
MIAAIDDARQNYTNTQDMGNGARQRLCWNGTSKQGVRVMEEAKALDILSALANGVHPETGEMFASDSPYQSPDVVRALFVAIRALETRGRLANRRRAELPSNAGKPWSSEEDRKLLAAFDEGGSLKQLADTHQRTLAGIQARLEKYKRIEPNAQAFRYSPKNIEPPQTPRPGTASKNPQQSFTR